VSETFANFRETTNICCPLISQTIVRIPVCVTIYLLFSARRMQVEGGMTVASPDDRVYIL
jgi:hypothetical protein